MSATYACLELLAALRAAFGESLGLQDVLLARREPCEPRLGQREGVETSCEAALLDVLDVLGHDVVSFGAVPRQLICMVALEDVSACVGQIDYDLKLTGERCKVGRHGTLAVPPKSSRQVHLRI